MKTEREKLRNMSGWGDGWIGKMINRGRDGWMNGWML